MTHGAADCWEKVHHLLYAHIRGDVYENQYVGTIRMSEETFEREVLHDARVDYNPLAYWKRHAGDGRNATGSYRLTHGTHPNLVEDGMQVHLTIFVARTNENYIDIYAHYEHDWCMAPIKHLREVDFPAQEGVDRARQFLRQNAVDVYNTHE